MSDLTTYITLGFHHIANLDAADHILFLLALAAVYRVAEWRSAIWVITAFTVGHSITLALAVTGALTLPTGLIEFLIPVTILATCIENLLAIGKTVSPGRRHFRAVLAGVFGLVHGAGFANYLKALFVDRIVVPLFGFNVGIELGQLVILGMAALGFVLVDQALGAWRKPAGSAFRLRVAGVSLVVAIFAARMVIQRSSW
ncbi:MAG: HupE/UreJ family protein [Gemmatimonadota bacterium]